MLQYQLQHGQIQPLPFGKRLGSLTSLREEGIQQVGVQNPKPLLRIPSGSADPVPTEIQNLSANRPAVWRDAPQLSNGLPAAKKIGSQGKLRRKVVCFGTRLNVLPDHNRVKILMECPNRSGSISSILSMIADYGVNLTEIHSRPFWQDNSWNYHFFAELHANLDVPEIRALIFQLSQETTRLQILGSYYCEEDS